MDKIIIEGNIGAGKSTILKALAYCYDVRPEPISTWPFEEYLKDPIKNFKMFHKAIIHSFRQRDMGQNFIAERCIGSVVNIFLKRGIKKHLISEDEISQLIMDEERDTNGVILFLETTPEECFTNLQQRGQIGDNCITLKDLYEIESLYNKWLPTCKNVIKFKTLDDLLKILKNKG